MGKKVIYMWQEVSSCANVSIGAGRSVMTLKRRYIIAEPNPFILSTNIEHQLCVRTVEGIGDTAENKAGEFPMSKSTTA